MFSGRWIFPLLALSIFSSGENSDAASASGRISLTVVSSVVSVKAPDEFQLSPAHAGARSKRMLLHASDGDGFYLSGEPGQAFTIATPRLIKLTTAGDDNKKDAIYIQSIRSSIRSSGVLNADGQSIVKIQGTRRALKARQRPGIYRGSYQIDLIY